MGRSVGLNKIFVEGDSDKAFIEAVLSKQFGIVCNKSENRDLVINTGGKDNLINQPDLVNQERRSISAKNIVIFDADYETKNGGIKRRREEYEEIGKRINSEFIVYLLPNDEAEGELEKLISTCFKKEFAFFDSCWKTMISCLENQKDFKLNLPNIKGYIYAYEDLLEAHKLSKLKFDFLDTGIWNLEIEENIPLQKLTHFIESNLFEEK